MTPEELDEVMGILGLNAQRLARCIGVTDRAVRRWLEGTRKIPAPVETLMDLVMADRSARRWFIAPERLPTSLAQWATSYIQRGGPRD